MQPTPARIRVRLGLRTVEGIDETKIPYYLNLNSREFWLPQFPPLYLLSNKLLWII